MSRFYYLVEQHLSALACLPHADLVPRALGICGAPAVSTLRVITRVYFIGCSVCSTPAKRVILTLPHVLRRKCAPLKALACKKALYVNKALKNSLYSHKEPFCVGDERRKQGRGAGEKQREEGLTSQQETGTIESPARIRHVALTDITCAMPPQRRAHCTDQETYLHDT